MGWLVIHPGFREAATENWRRRKQTISWTAILRNATVRESLCLDFQFSVKLAPRYEWTITLTANGTALCRRVSGDSARRKEGWAVIPHRSEPFISAAFLRGSGRTAANHATVAGLQTDDSSSCTLDSDFDSRNYAEMRYCYAFISNYCAILCKHVQTARHVWYYQTTIVDHHVL